MPLPPGARPLNVAEVRRQFATGTLGTVGDDAGSEHVERDGVAPNLDGAYGDAVSHIESICPWYTVRAKREAAERAEDERQARLKRWQAQRV